jgi:hypothetical protein
LRIGQGNYLYNGVGTLVLNSGTVRTLTGQNFRLGCFGGTGTVTQNGGVFGSDDFTMHMNQQVFLSNGSTEYYVGQEGGTGTYNLTGGTLNSPWTSLGYGGQGSWAGPGQWRNAPLTNGVSDAWGYFNQSGGVHNTALLTVGGGWDSGGVGVYTITGGNLNATDIQLGKLDGNGTGNQWNPNGTPGWTLMIAPVGTFDQNGGTVTVTSSITVGADLCNLGGYGGHGIGTYNFYAGTLTDGSAGANLIVRDSAPATGTFQGNGVVSLTGTLTNNGRVIADGGLLDMSSFSTVTSTVANTVANGATTNGWFAKNGGTLTLPAISVSGSGTYAWGDTVSASALTLVNSVQAIVGGYSASGNLSISLMDPAAMSGTRRIGGIVDVWDVTTKSFTSSSLGLTFRVDDTLNGDNQKLFYSLNGSTGWTQLTTTDDSVDHLLTAASVPGVGYYALGLAHAGDITLDGQVGVDDFSVLLAHWGSSSTSWTDGNFLGAGNVGIDDFSILLSNWGWNSGLGSSMTLETPEPTTLVLLGLGGLAMLRRRKA